MGVIIRGFIWDIPILIFAYFFEALEGAYKGCAGASTNVDRSIDRTLAFFWLTLRTLTFLGRLQV